VSIKTRFKQQSPDLLRIVRLAKYEVDLRIAHWRGRLSIAQRARLRALRQSTGLRVNLACGRTTEPGWVNVDASRSADVCVDLRRPLPLASRSASQIFCEHFCDHLSFPHAITRFLGECHRVLAPGGRARFVLHDAIDLMRACVEQDARYFEVAEVMRPTALALNLVVAGFAAAPTVLSPAAAQRWRTRLGWLGLALIVTFWIWRNTAAYPWLRL